MERSIKIWSALVLIGLALLMVAAICLRQSFLLTAFSDVIQCLFLMSGTLSFLKRAYVARGRMRWFWSCMTLGMALWLSYQFLWTYFEVALRTDVPDLYSGDIILFVHLVPFIAALALRPHLPRDQYAARLGHLDFALLLIWWVYLYVLLVMAWQYATPDLTNYDSNLNAVYLFEKLFYLAALAACWMQSRDSWKTFYANLFGASLVYAASSYIANWALHHNVYYSGSLFDIPLVASMAWMTIVALWNRTGEVESTGAKNSTAYGVWVARCGMIATFSLPLFGAWTLADTSLTPRVRSFRIILTLAASLVMGMMVLTRQRLLDRELKRLLNDSRESFENLKRLQAQILQSEKMASIGQLVGGAAHELNNPITAMLGYSDLLLATKLSPEQQTLATQISQQTRRTRTLVASLLSFARRSPVAKSPVDLNILVRTAVKLTQPQWQSLQIGVSTDLDPNLPKVMGDSNQLLQVCLQAIGNSVRSLHERSGSGLTLTTGAVAGSCVMTINECFRRDTEQPAAEVTTADALDLGSTTSRAIIEEHQGKISSHRSTDGACTLRLELPGIPLSQAKTSATKALALWQVSH